MLIDEDRIVLIDGCHSPAQVAELVESLKGVPGIVIIGVDPAHKADCGMAMAMQFISRDRIVMLDVREIEPAPEAIFMKQECPRPAESRRRQVWEGMKRIAGADIRRFLPRRT